MKRIALFFLTVCFTAFVFAAVSNAQTGEDSCTREDLTKTTDKYFGSIQEHKTSDLPLASTVKFTENGVKKDVGKGFWETAGKPLLRRTLIDTRKCVAATMAVMEEPFSSKTVRSPSTGGRGGFSGGAGTSGGGARGGGMFGGSGPMPDEGTIRPILFAARLKVEKGKITD
jgi:hypothetical protein